MSQSDNVEHRGTSGDVSPLALVNVVLRERRLVMRSVAVFALLGGVYLALRTTEFTAPSRFVPEVPAGAASSISGLASQLGLAAGATAQLRTFYASLLTSKDVVRAVATAEYRFASGPGGRDTVVGKLAELYKLKGETEDSRDRQAVGLVKEMVATSVDAKDGTIRLAVTARWPGLAEQINRRLLEQLNEFNLEKRQSLAAAERSFTERRLVEAQEELRATETELQRFLETNRGYQNSPRLAFEATRLQRRVDLRQQVYATLAQAYEQARINQVRDTPVITVVEGPEGSAFRGARPPVVVLVIAAFLGGMFGVGLAFVRDYFHRQQILAPTDFEEFGALGMALLGPLMPRFLRERLRAALGRSRAS